MHDPTLAIMVNGQTGEITGVHVLSKDADERHEGHALVQALRQQLEMFQDVLRERVRQLQRTH